LSNKRSCCNTRNTRHLNKRAHPQIRSLIGMVLKLFNQNENLSVFVRDLVGGL